MTDEERCTSQCHLGGAVRRCQKSAGHGGVHTDGSYQWADETYGAISAPYEQCAEWVDDAEAGRSMPNGTKIKCGYTRNAHDGGALGHDFLSEAEYNERCSQGFEQARHVPKRHRDFVPRDMLVRVDDDAIVNPSFVAALIEDTYTHRDGSTTKTSARVSIYLHNRQHPIVVENATLDEVCARLDVSSGDTARSPFDDIAVAQQLIGESTNREDFRKTLNSELGGL